MKYLTRSNKGTYGYIRRQTVFEIIKTVVMFAMAFGLYFMGYLTLHTNKSLWSILAVLALLPASKSMVGVIMLARFRSLSPQKYDSYSKAAGHITTLYENIFTTTQRTFFVPVMCVTKGAVTCYANLDQTDINTLQEHLSGVLKNAGHDFIVKAFSDENAFILRISSLADKDDVCDFPAVTSTLKAVSL